MNQTEPTQAQLAAAFALYANNKGVVYAAVHHAGIHPAAKGRGHLPRSGNDATGGAVGTYADYVQEGIIFYVNYYCRYQEPLDTPAAVTKFNRLAGYFIKRETINRQNAERRRRNQAGRDVDYLADAPDEPVAQPDFTQVEFPETLAAFTTTLTPAERRLVVVAVTGKRDGHELASVLNVTLGQVARLRRHIRTKYQRYCEQVD